MQFPQWINQFDLYLVPDSKLSFDVQDIANGPMKHWNTAPAPEVAIRYWKLAVSIRQQTFCSGLLHSFNHTHGLLTVLKEATNVAWFEPDARVFCLIFFSFLFFFPIT